MTPQRARHVAAPGVFLAAALAVAWPFLKPGYVLALDLAWGPATTWSLHLWGAAPDSSARFPVLLVLQALAWLLGPEVTEKLLLVGVLAGAAAAMYAAAPGGLVARVAAGLLYGFNPFVAVRLSTGQVLLLLGYAALPLVVLAMERLLRDGRRRWTWLLVGATLVAGVQVHLLALALAYALVRVALHERPLEAARRAAPAGVLLLAFTAYWWVRLLAGSSAPAVDPGDPLVYRAHGPLAQLLALGGFWRDPRSAILAPPPWWQLVLVATLFMAALGAVLALRSTSRRRAAWTMLALSAASLVLVALLAYAPPGGAVARAWGAFLPLAAFRDSHKLLALVALAQAWFAAVGLDALAAHRARTARLAAPVVAVVLAAAFVAPLVGGVGGALGASPFPDDYAEAARSASPGSVTLVLPWNQYLDVSWVQNADKRVVSPAPEVFGPSTRWSLDPELGGNGSLLPSHAWFLAAWGMRDNVTHLGRVLAPSGVGTLVVLKEARWEESDAFLRRQADLDVVHESARLVVYRNREPASRAYAYDAVVRVPDLATAVRLLEAGAGTSNAFLVDPAAPAPDAAALSTAPLRPVPFRERAPHVARFEAPAGARLAYVPAQLAEGAPWGEGPRAAGGAVLVEGASVHEREAWTLHLTPLAVGALAGAAFAAWSRRRAA